MWKVGALEAPRRRVEKVHILEGGEKGYQCHLRQGLPPPLEEKRKGWLQKLAARFYEAKEPGRGRPKWRPPLPPAPP